MMRAWLYHRVSTLDQNPDAARAELRSAARQLGARVAGSIEETGSGANNTRPGLAKLMRSVRRGDVVIVWKLDRFGRSALDVLTNVRRLQDLGVRFYCSSQGLDIRADGDAMAQLFLTVLAACAEFERSLIQDRTRMGLAAARKRGVKLGRPRAQLPDAGDVAILVEENVCLRQIAKELGTTVWRVRCALDKAK